MKITTEKWKSISEDLQGPQDDEKYILTTNFEINGGIRYG